MNPLNYLAALFGLISLASVFTGCNQKSAVDSKMPPLAQRGLKTYKTYCIVCHNKNPAKAGSLGPDLKNSSLELIRLRVLERKYPAGYKPKRGTSQMTAFPQLKNEIEALHAYIEFATQKQGK